MLIEQSWCRVGERSKEPGYAREGIPDRAGPPSRRLSAEGCGRSCSRAAEVAGVDHAIPHQLRHIYATARFNASVSPESLMALPGHVSAEMTLRYGGSSTHRACRVRRAAQPRHGGPARLIPGTSRRPAT